LQQCPDDAIIPKRY